MVLVSHRISLWYMQHLSLACKTIDTPSPRPYHDKVPATGERRHEQAVHVCNWYKNEYIFCIEFIQPSYLYTLMRILHNPVTIFKTYIFKLLSQYIFSKYSLASDSLERSPQLYAPVISCFVANLNSDW